MFVKTLIKNPPIFRGHMTSRNQGLFAASVEAWRWAEIRPWVRGCPWHWLDLVFEKFKTGEFITRLLGRTNFVHRQFGHGKLHSVSKATADDLNSHLKSPSPLLPKDLWAARISSFSNWRRVWASTLKRFATTTTTILVNTKSLGTILSLIYWELSICCGLQLSWW